MKLSNLTDFATSTASNVTAGLVGLSLMTFPAAANDSDKPKTNAEINAEISVAAPTASINEMNQARVNADAFSVENKDGIGIMFFKGKDSGNLSIEAMKSILESRFDKFDVDAQAHGALNAVNPDVTAISFFHEGRLYGPFTTVDAFNEIPAMAGRVKGNQALASVSLSQE